MNILIFRSTRLFIFQYQIEFLQKKYPQASWTIISPTAQEDHCYADAIYQKVITYRQPMFASTALNDDDQKFLREQQYDLVIVPIIGREPHKYLNITDFLSELVVNETIFLNEHLEIFINRSGLVFRTGRIINNGWRRFLRFISKGRGRVVTITAKNNQAKKILMICMEGLPTPPVLDGAIPRVTNSVCHDQTRYGHYLLSPYHPNAYKEGQLLDSGFFFVKKNNIARALEWLRNGRFTRRLFFEFLDPHWPDTNKWQMFLETAVRQIVSLSPEMVVIQNMPALVPQVKRMLPTSEIYLFMHNNYYMFLGDKEKKEILKGLSGVITISQQLALETEKTFAENKIPVKVVTNGIDLNYFKPQAKSEKKNADKRRILFASRVHPSKGLYQLIKAFQLLQKELPDVELAVAGISYHSLWRPIKGYEAFIQGIIKETDNIVPLGYVKYSDMPLELHQADLFVLPSTFIQEGMPSAIIEAQACGVPVIGSYEGGIPEIIDDGISGFLVDPTDSQKLCHLMKSILTDEDLSRKLVSKALEQVKKFSSKETMAELYADAINSFIDK